MAEFCFDEFLNEVKNVKAENGLSRNERIISIVLSKMDKLCPNSYMPYLFLYAAATDNLELAKLEQNENADSISQQLAYPHDDQTAFTEGNAFIKDNPVFKDQLSKVFNAIFNHKKIGEEEWQFIAQFIDLMLVLANRDAIYYWRFRGISNNALEVLEHHDPFFTTKFDKILYLALIEVLKNFMPENPDNKDHYFEEVFYMEMNDWTFFFDNLIIEQYKKNHPIEQYVVPEAFKRIANGLFMDAEQSIIYDPYCHLGDFALNVNPHMSEYREYKSPVGFISDIKDDETICATTLRLLFHDERTLYDFKDVVKESISASHYFVTIPLFSNTVQKGEGELDPNKYSIKKGLECVHNGGKMMCVIPSAYLINKKTEDIRRSLTNTGYETKLIFMPTGCLNYSDIATTIVFVNGKKTSDSIKFIDASRYVKHNDDSTEIDFISISNLCYHDTDPRFVDGKFVNDFLFQFGNRFWNGKDSTHYLAEFGEEDNTWLPEDAFTHDTKIVLKEEIRQNDYSLNPSLYCDHIVLIPEGYETRNLKDILVKVKDVNNESEEGKVISAKDLQANGYFVEFDPERIVLQQKAEDTPAYKLTTGSYILASKIGKLNPTAMKVKNTAFVSQNSVSAYKIVDKTISPAYLASQMREKYFVNQLQYTNIVSGHINDMELSVLNIFVPIDTINGSSLSIQQSIVQKEMLTKMQMLDDQYQQLRDQRFNEYIIVLRQRKHRLAQILNQVCPAFNLLNKTREKSNGVLKDADVVATRTGENVAQYFGKVQQGLDKIERLIETFVDKNQWGKAELFALEDFVNEFTQKHICKNYKIQLLLNNISDIDNVNNNDVLAKRMVNIPKDELSTVFENIIANAETWGFTDKNREDYVIRISLGDADNGEHAVVTITNNGTPIHPSVDRKHIFDWGVGNHTGVGTWQAKNIIEHYGGHIHINEYPKAKDGFQTEYEITLQREY